MNIKNLKINKNSNLFNKNLICSLISLGISVYFSVSIPFYRQYIKAYNLTVTEINNNGIKTYSEYVLKKDYKDKENVIYLFDKWTKENNLYIKNVYILKNNCLDKIDNIDDLFIDKIYLDKKTITSNKIPDEINDSRKVIIYNLDYEDVTYIKEDKDDNLFNSIMFLLSGSASLMYITNYHYDIKLNKEKRL